MKILTISTLCLLIEAYLPYTVPLFSVSIVTWHTVVTAVIWVVSLWQLPVITDLRNPTLKPRHWEVIEQILDYHFTPEDPLTLGKLVEINAFRNSEALQEISGQASSEASLEAILKKVWQ